MRTEGYYYIDKTGLIRDLLENPGKVNLFTRPGRFGKTLNMSMLRYFFEAGSDRFLFDGLEISKEMILSWKQKVQSLMLYALRQCNNATDKKQEL